MDNAKEEQLQELPLQEALPARVHRDATPPSALNSTRPKVLYMYSGPLDDRLSLQECVSRFGISCDSYDKCLGSQGDLSDELVWEPTLGEDRKRRVPLRILFVAMQVSSSAPT